MRVSVLNMLERMILELEGRMRKIGTLTSERSLLILAVDTFMSKYKE